MPSPAFIQMDCDGVWAVRECYGLPAGEYLENDPVYREGIPRFLELLKKRGIRASFFIVGRDARVPQKRDMIARVIGEGHEIGNHSDDHTLGLTRLPGEKIKTSISNAQNAIAGIISSSGFSMEHLPVGFRSPGYDCNQRVLRIALELGMRYDASLFPTWWGFVMRLMDGWISGRSPWRKSQYGSLTGGFQSLAPHVPHGIDGLMEIPVSVSPALRLPFHFGISLVRGFSHFHRNVEAYKKRNLPLLYLFHGIDLVDTRDLPLLPSRRGRGFFQVPLEKKIEFAERVLDELVEGFEIHRARDWVEENYRK